MSDWKRNILDNLGYKMCVWHNIDCGDGWRPLVEYAAQFVANRPCLQLAQIKEKFGLLRIYVSHDIDCNCKAPDDWDCLEAHLEHLSGYTCERCGAYGETRNDNHWQVTLCDKCREKETT